jgi:hypothetical protein
MTHSTSMDQTKENIATNYANTHAKLFSTIQTQVELLVKMVIVGAR